MRLSRRAWLGAMTALCAAVAACSDSAPPVAPTQVAVTLATRADVVPPGGSMALTATVTNLAGGMAPDGTPVRFTTTLGRVDPAETTTRNGLATATFYADSATGTAEVRSSSGSVTSNTVQLSVGGTAVRLSLAAVDLGGHNVLATATLQGGTATQYEWFFERQALPEVVTLSNQARYVYPSPGFKDLTVRVTLSDGRRLLGGTSVIVE